MKKNRKPILNDELRDFISTLPNLNPNPSKENPNSFDDVYDYMNGFFKAIDGIGFDASTEESKRTLILLMYGYDALLEYNKLNPIK